MEYISGKELFDYIINKRHLDELESCKFYQQIISGIEYLGKTKVAHRDLKPENLLLDSKKNIKIVDFGLSNTYFQNELLSTACGSPCYAAPEMLSGEKYNGINIDIWSSGIVLYAMLCGYLPFEDNDNPKLYKKIIKGVFETPEFLSSNAVDLLHRILNVDPKKRYTIAQIKEHPWFNQINPKINMSEGLLIDNYIIPFDEEIINKMVNEYSYNEQQIKVNLLFNKHNHITATYFLILKKFIRIGKKSIGDMTSQLFIDYINDQKNLFSSYDYDLNYIIVERILNKKNTDNKESLNKKDDIEKEREKEKEEEKNKEIENKLLNHKNNINNQKNKHKNDENKNSNGNNNKKKVIDNKKRKKK
jgi:5'-AMP-activated protein kinase catalytic alpha subunit